MTTGLVETLEAVKPYVENNQYVGLACAMKNAGVGVGIPDTGRCRLVVEDGKLHIFAGASCIGQGLGTVLTQRSLWAVSFSCFSESCFRSSSASRR